MSKVIVDISMSLDGFVTGPDAGVDRGLGRGGEALHAWALDGRTAADERILEASLERTGAVVMGRNTFDVVDGPHGWSDEMGFGGHRDGSELPPNFVVTHSEPEKVRLQDAFTVVTGGLGPAIEQARAAAGDRDVTVMGGGSVCRQTIERGLADEIVIHLAPLVLGGGTPLFNGTGGDEPVGAAFELLTAQSTPSATHLRYRVDR